LELSAVLGGAGQTASGAVQIKAGLADGEGAVLGDPGKADPGTPRAAAAGADSAVLSWRRVYLHQRRQTCRGPGTGLAFLGRPFDLRPTAARTWYSVCCL